MVLTSALLEWDYELTLCEASEEGFLSLAGLLSFRSWNSICTEEQVKLRTVHSQNSSHKEQYTLRTLMAEVLDEPYSQLSPLSGVAVQARQST